jgi:hypothetical protein
MMKKKKTNYICPSHVGLLSLNQYYQAARSLEKPKIL